MLRFTLNTGAAVHINPAHIVAFTESERGSGTAITVSTAGTIHVRENAAEVLKQISDAQFRAR